MSFLKSDDGTQLFYRDCGKGRPLVFVHGWCINSDSWEYMINILCDQGYRCIAYDHRGCGRSEHAWNGYDYGTLGDDLAAVINHLRLKDVTLIGHSTGCGIICHYLADYGEINIEKAVLIGTNTPYISYANDNPDGVPTIIRDETIQLMKTDRPAYIYSIADGFFDFSAEGNTVSRQMVDWAVNLTLQASARASEAMFVTSFNIDLRNLLSRINIPVLILHGDKDVSSPLEITALPTHKLLANSRLKIYEGLAHGMYIYKARQLCEDIISFIGEAVVI